MRRFLLAALLSIAVLPSAALAQTYNSNPALQGMAPADKYFGRMRLSILGIRNTIADAGTNLDVDQANPHAIFHKVVLADEALHDWARQFPHDPWIPRYILALANLYHRLPGDEARTFANDTIDWLTSEYPKSNEAHLATDFSRSY